MRRLVSVLSVATVLALPMGLRAQEQPIRTQLMARGAPAGFAERVGAIVSAAAADGLPTDPLTTKALEGWAKRSRVSADRVIAVLEGVAGNLRAGRGATVDAGLDPAPGEVVAAAAEALGRGMTREDVAAVIAAANTAEQAATGLTVASSLAAQGLDRSAAVRAVRDAYQQGRAAQDVLELPSAVAGLVARGVPMSDVARQILEGGGLPLPTSQGLGFGRRRPGTVPPGRGPPMEPPGQGKPKNPGEKGKPPGS